LYRTMPDEMRTIGEILREAREKRELSLDEVALLTKVRVKYLAAIEADHFDALPSKVQKKGFVRTYARVLELDPAPLLAQLRDVLDEDELLPEEVIPPISPPDQSEEIQPLGEIGSVLKTQRERLGFSLDNIESQIFIPERYLKAIESGSLEELPSTVQGKGMVKNYAQFLGLDPEPLLLGYADVLQKRLAQTREAMPAAKSPSSALIHIRRFLTSPNILWVGVVVLISAVSIWSGWLIFGSQGTNPNATATIPGVADILLPSPTNTATPEIQDATPGDIEVDITASPDGEELENTPIESTAVPAFTGSEKVQVQLNIVLRTWVRVTVDNIVVFEGRLLPGSLKLYGGELKIEVLTGNAAGVEVIFNQQDQGVMGLYGEVVDRIYTAEGVATPTPTITPTLTPSVTPQATPTPTATLGGDEG
jgi:cytoskeleton protein RodZ